MSNYPWTDTTPTKEDLNLSTIKINEVIQKLKDLQATEKYSHKLYIPSFKVVFDQMDIAIELHSGIIDKANQIKTKLDESHILNNSEKFEESYNEFKNLINSEFGLTSKLKLAKRRVTYSFTVSKMYSSRLIRMLDWFVSVRDNGEKTLKRMRMSEKQRISADKTSERMSVAWGM